MQRFVAHGTGHTHPHSFTITYPQLCHTHEYKDTLPYLVSHNLTQANTQRFSHTHILPSSLSHKDSQSWSHTRTHRLMPAHTWTLSQSHMQSQAVTFAHTHAQKVTHTITALHPESHPRAMWACVHTHAARHADVHICSSGIDIQSLSVGPLGPLHLLSCSLEHGCPQSGCPCPAWQK